ncbi:MAG TPA: trypsin-like peptidase domain-containing protein [Dehalococcoidales bacterium]|nr:trypsin-like peptidase domain-containing protein [Dehalococcoidales bacterium]
MKRTMIKCMLFFPLCALLYLPVLLVGCVTLQSPSVSSPGPVTGSPVVSTPTNKVVIATETAGTPLPDIISVVEKVKPCVVAINDEITSTSRRGGTTTSAAAGSGWIMDPDGLIITNNHVISGAQNIIVSLNDGRIFPAQSVAADPVNDLAVIKVDAKGLPAATIGNSEQVQIGQQVVAIGNALGDGIRVTAGIISNLGKSITLSAAQTLYDLIETDAAINPGNSGGVLVNMSGEVIGIVNAKVSASGIEGMGYAISTSTAVPILQQLINQGYVIQPWIGAVFETVDPGVAIVNGLDAKQGVLITNVSANSPASAAGLQVNDVILTIDGKDMTSASQAATVIAQSQIGEQLQISYQRGSSRLTTMVTTVKNPMP